MPSLAAAALLLVPFAPLQSDPPPGSIIVRSETGEPLPGAKVLGLDNGDLMSLFFAPPDASSFEEALEQVGTKLVADAAGRIQVPVDLQILWGRSGERRGTLELGPRPLPASFVLEPRPRITVRVEDAAGGPAAGARIVIRGYAAGAQACLFGVGKTNAAGELAFAHFFPFGEMFQIERWSAGLAVVGAPPVEAFYDPGVPPAEALALIRAPTGTVVLRSVDGQGERISCEETVQVFAGVETPLNARFTDGEVRLEEVLLGARLRIVPIPIGDWRASETEIEGPSRPGEVREHALAFAPASTPPGEVMISARVLDPQGRPVAREFVMCSVEARSGDDWEKSELTSGTGQLSFSVERGLLQSGPATLTLRIEREDGTALQRRLQLPDAAERVELGDTSLEPGPLMLFGRVVDGAGKPVPGAEVQVSAVSRIQLVGEEPREKRTLGRPRLRTDAEGRFELRGVDLGLRGSLGREVRAFSADLGRTRWRPFGDPGAEVVLELAAPAFLRGRVVVDEGVDPALLRIDAAYRGEIPQESGAGGTHVERDGAFRLGPLAAEPCDLFLWIDPDRSLAVPFSGQPDLVLEDLRPGAEEAVWDLRGKLHAYELSVLRPDGKPAESPNLLYRSGRKQIVRLYQGTHGRPVRVLSADRPLDVRVEEEGFRAASIRLDGPRGELKLSGGIAVKLTLANLPDLGEDGFLTVTLRGGDPSALSSSTPNGMLDRRGSGELLVMEPGSYRVTLQYQRRVGALVWSGATSWGVDLPQLEIADREGQSFELTLPDELIETFRREVERDL